MSHQNDEQVHYSLLDIDQVFRVPAVPGIYVWFLKFQLPHRYAESTEGVKEVSQEIAKLRDYLRPPQILLESPSLHGAKWGGEISLAEVNERENSVADVHENLRLNHLSHLNHVFQMLMPVLYIGKADNLKRRLEQHVTAIKRFEDGERLDFEFDGREFSERVFKLNINPLTLRFTYFEYPSNDVNVTPQDIFKSNTLVEKTVNQVLRPTLGKR